MLHVAVIACCVFPRRPIKQVEWLTRSPGELRCSGCRWFAVDYSVPAPFSRNQRQAASGLVPIRQTPRSVKWKGSTSIGRR